MRYKQYPYISSRSLVWPCVFIVFLFSCRFDGKESGGAYQQHEVNVSPDSNSLPVHYALGFRFGNLDGYKVLHIINHYQEQRDTSSYFLVPRGVQLPEDLPSWPVIRTPIRKIVMMSTTHVALLDALDAHEVLVGLPDTQYLWNKDIRKMVSDDKIASVGIGSNLDLERVMSLRPDVLMAVGFPDTNHNTYPTLEASGIPVIYNAEWQEKSVLGRAEWLKVMAALLHKEQQAHQFFTHMTVMYDSLKSIAANVADKPLVVCNVPNRGTWFVPGGESYAAQLILDAGGEYPWEEFKSSGSMALDFEEVYQVGLKAEFWVTVGNNTTRQQLYSVDSRFGDFQAFHSGRIYNNTRRWEEGRGNAYWEEGMIRPDYILADLIKIFHPELLPDHELFFFENIE